MKRKHKKIIVRPLYPIVNRSAPQKPTGVNSAAKIVVRLLFTKRASHLIGSIDSADLNIFGSRVTKSLTFH